MSFAPGTVLDRYTVEGILGQGGMAVVYKVRHTQLGSFHALKVLSAPSPIVKDRMLREGRVQGSLRHPNIVPVTDLVEISGSPGLVMEFVDGPSLEALLERFRPTLEQADALAIGILEGTACAHRKGFIHRDLKPANVLLAASPTGLVPKISDFGLAKLVSGDDASDGLHQTRSGMVMGTPAYMAPEQIRDSKHVDHRADVFSLGVMLYELVSGRKPFVGTDIVQLYTAITSGKYRPLQELVPNVPDRMERAIVGALAVDRNARIQDCDRLLAIWKGDQSVRRSSTAAEKKAAGASSTMVPDMPQPFFPESSGDVNREITFQDHEALQFGARTTRDHPLLSNPAGLRFAAPIGEIDPMSDAPPSPHARRPVLASIDPSGGAVEVDPDFGDRFGVGGAVAAVIVAIVLVGGGLILAMGGYRYAEAWSSPAPAIVVPDPPPAPTADPVPDPPAPSKPPAPRKPAATAPKPAVAPKPVEPASGALTVEDVRLDPTVDEAVRAVEPVEEPVRAVISGGPDAPPVDTPPPER